MRYISLCSGIEAASAAWLPLGWTPVAFSEIDPFPCRVLKHHHPGVPNHGDFTAFDWSVYRGAVDVLIAGTPCQAFSVAGLRGSLTDARGNLTLEFINAANAIQPGIIVWENVPGVLSTDDNAFGCFLAGLVGCDEPIMAERGWPNAGVVHGPERAACWRVLNAEYFGLAQRRKRVFVVACPRNGADPAEILFEFASLRRDSPPLREKGQKPSGGVAARIGSGGGLGTDFELDGGLVPEISLCLNAGGMGRLDSETETFVVSPPLTQNPYGDNESREGLLVAHTLRGRGFDGSEDGTGRGTPLVPVAFVQNGRDEVRLMGGDGSIVGALATEPGAKQQCYVATACMSSQLGAYVELAPTLRSEPGGLGYPTSIGLAVRRLTPLECDRLQGFPDGHTAIPHCKDSPRYKAIGNSMARPVIEWIGRRIDLKKA